MNLSDISPISLIGILICGAQAVNFILGSAQEATWLGVSLLILFAIVVGIVWGTIHTVLTYKNTRDHILSAMNATLMKIVGMLLANPATSQLITKIGSHALGLFQPQPQESAKDVVITHGGQVLDIFYTLEGKKYSLMVPYSRRDANRVDRTYGQTQGGKLEDLYHCSGVPILVTADMLGYTEIIKRNDEDTM